MCGKLTQLEQRTLEADDTTMRYAPFTKWMPTIGLDEVVAVMKARAVLGSPSWQLAVQYAAVRTDLPDAWAVLDALQANAGERCTGPVSLTNAPSKMFVRFGMGYKSAAGATLAQLDATLQLAMEPCGMVIGTYAFHPVATDTNTRYQPITDWIPSAHAAKVKAALISTSLAGTNFQFQLAQQKAATSVEVPGAWATIEAGWRNTATEACTGEITLSYTNQFWTRFGIAYNVSSGTFAEADLAAIVAVRS
jgi:hypothetical protein